MTHTATIKALSSIVIPVLKNLDVALIYDIYLKNINIPMST